MVPLAADAPLALRELAGGQQVAARAAVGNPAGGAQGPVGGVEVVHLAAVLLAAVEHGAVLAVQDGLGGQPREARGHGSGHLVEVVPLAVDAPLAVGHGAVLEVVHRLGLELREAGRHGAGRLVEVVPLAADAPLALIRLAICRKIKNAVFSFFPMISQALSKPIVNVNVTAYTGNAATGRILPAIIFGRGIRSKAEALIVTASVPILGSPDAPATRKKARVGKVVLEPVNVCVNTGLIPRCRNLTAEGLCDRCELRGIVKWRPLGRTIGICFLLFQVIVNGKGGRMTLKGT